jgi:hypothetical protein
MLDKLINWFFVGVMVVIPAIVVLDAVFDAIKQ